MISVLKNIIKQLF